VKNTLSALLTLTLAGGIVAQDEKKLDPAITALSNFVGGKWMSEGGPVTVEQEWSWNRDKRGLNGVTLIGKGTPGMMQSKAFIGWDPLAKKAYYLDMHDSEVTYYGHATEKDGTIEFRFGRLGSGKVSWVDRGKFVSKDEYRSTMYELKDGKENAIMSFTLKRQH
jgi:hypothetical protein